MNWKTMPTDNKPIYPKEKDWCQCGYLPLLNNGVCKKCGPNWIPWVGKKQTQDNKGKTMIHTVKNPFYCRQNQFGKDRELVVGIDYNALKKQDPYRIRIGKNSTILSAPKVDILRIAQKWTNPKGRTVLITPLRVFKEEKWSTNTLKTV